MSAFTHNSGSTTAATSRSRACNSSRLILAICLSGRFGATEFGGTVKSSHVSFIRAAASVNGALATRPSRIAACLPCTTTSMFSSERRRTCGSSPSGKERRYGRELWPTAPISRISSTGYRSPWPSTNSWPRSSSHAWVKLGQWRSSRTRATTNANSPSSREVVTAPTTWPTKALLYGSALPRTDSRLSSSRRTRSASSISPVAHGLARSPSCSA